MLMEILISFAFAALVSYWATPWVIRLAAHIEAVDRPDERKIHEKPTLLLGGLAVFISFFLALPLTQILYPNIFFDLGIDAHIGKTIVVSCTFMLMLGIWDDLQPMTAGGKFIIQLLVSTIVYAGGVKIKTLTDPIGGGTIELGLMAYPLTIFWIIGITNSLNLIDGLDGLAGGVAGIAGLTICAVASFKGDTGTALLSIVLAGAILGFLPYNFHPAKIFLGDSGSLLLGFMLALISALGSTKGSTAFALSVPVLALGLPIADTLLAVVRRSLRPLLSVRHDNVKSNFSMRAIFLPDRDHIHHRLIGLGLSHRDAVLLLYVISGALGASAFAQSMMNHFAAMLIMIVAGTFVIIGVWRLHYREMAVFNNGILLSMYDSSPLHRGWSQGVGDALFMAFSYAFCYGLLRGFRLILGDIEHMLPRIGVVAVTQAFVCWVSGMYRGDGRFYGPGNFFRLFTTVALAVTTSGLTLFFTLKISHYADLLALVLDFFVLLAFLLTTGLAFRMLSYLSHRKKGRKVVLVYGANASGGAYLRYALHSKDHSFFPAGFVDESPEIIGATVEGYPFHGGISVIPQLTRRIRIDEILVASSTVDAATLERLRAVARSCRLSLRRVTMREEAFTLEDLPVEN